ncbi:unnamed protein product, partial [Ectocarpus sp. 13 AM-2016]
LILCQTALSVASIPFARARNAKLLFFIFSSISTLPVTITSSVNCFQPKPGGRGTPSFPLCYSKGKSTWGRAVRVRAPRSRAEVVPPDVISTHTHTIPPAVTVPNVVYDASSRAQEEQATYNGYKRAKQKQKESKATTTYRTSGTLFGGDSRCDL